VIFELVTVAQIGPKETARGSADFDLEEWSVYLSQPVSAESLFPASRSDASMRKRRTGTRRPRLVSEYSVRDLFGGVAMTETALRPRSEDAVSRSFFEELPARGHQPLLEKVSGTLRFKLTRGSQVEHWYLTITDGDIGVTRRKGPADVVVTVEGRLLDQIVTGTANTMAAMLRGAIEVEGDLGLLLAFQRLFPGPPLAIAGREHDVTVSAGRDTDEQ